MKFSIRFKNYLLFSFLLILCLVDNNILKAQDIKPCARTVATCYAQDDNEPVGVIYDTRFNAGAPVGDDWTTVPDVHPTMWTRGRIGNVFGITLNDQSGDIYLAATDVYNYDGLYPPNGLSASAEGPGGTGGVYKTNIDIPNVTTPIVFTTNSAGLAAYNTGNDVPNTGGKGNGIGNIVCNQNNGDLFFTNLEDGRIYRTDANGNLLGAFDPFDDDSNTPGFQEIPEERIWGIDIYTDISNTTRIYFAREEGSTNTKQIWSIELDASGQFTGTASNGEYKDAEVLELDNIPGTQKKITDIAFAFDGRMLLAERGGPHSSAIFEYQTPSGWVSSGVPYFIGFSPGKNSAGGVDYGYKEKNENPSAICDALIWATGNCMEAAGIGGISCEVYGIEGISSTGNADWPSNAATDLFIDFDNVYVAQQKRQIGDVEQFKCGCPPDNSVCETITVNSKSSNGEGDSCCFVLNVDNQQADFFSGIQLCTNNGVSISAVGSLNGWTIGGYSSQFISLLPPSTSVPVGNMDFIEFCLSNYLNVPNQQVLVKYYGPDETLVCVDTLNYECSQKPKCLKITNEVDCADNGQYLMSFCIMSDALIGFDVNSIQLNPPPGITFTPSVFSVGNLTPGQMQCGFQTLVSGALDGDAICYSITAHKEDIFTDPDINPTECCTDTLMLGCVVMPDCICNKVSVSVESADQMGDTCCWNVTLNNGYSNNFFSGVQLDIITPGVVFGAIVNPFGSGWSSQSTSTQVVFKPKPLGTFIGASSTLPTFCLSGIDLTSQVPQEVVLSWLDPDGKTVCQDTLYFDCPPPVNTPCAELINGKIDCDLENPGIYTISFQVKNNSAFTANEIDLNNINPPFSIIPSVFSIPALAPTQTSAVLTAMVIGVVPNQNICFDLTLHDVSNGSELNCCTNPKQYCLLVPDCSNSCECPSPGPQLITNGDFEAGLTDFTSDYSLNSNCFPGRYNVANATTVVPMCNNWTGLDHTTGSPTGQFFVCDGSQTSGQAAWRQEVNILPSTSYDFCAFVNNLNEPGFDRDDPIIEVWLVDGLGNSTLLDSNTPSESPDVWVKMSANWIAPAVVNNPYKLEFRTASNSFEGNNFAIDDISFRQCEYTDPGNCCINIEAFCSNIENAVTITSNAESCKVKLNISEVVCDDYLEWIDWDFPSQQVFGPYLPNSTISHSYTSSGTYNVCFLAFERDEEGFICLEKLVCEEIEVNCEDCKCDKFEKIKVTNKKTGFSQGLECNSDFITNLECPNPGNPYKITGKLNCESADCSSTKIHWELKSKDTGNIVASGDQLSTWFSITLDNNVLTGLNGLYDLELTGMCGNDVCKCTLQFKISGCPKDQICPCNEEFLSRVYAGFSYKYSLGLGTCNVTFTPNRLIECDEVFWSINGQNISFNSSGSTMGNQPFTISIPINSSGGIYEVKMYVARPNTDCKTTFSQNVKLSCFILGEDPICIDNVIENPGFNQNTEPGILGFEGNTDGWRRIAGSPELLAIEGCTEPYAIKIKGKCWQQATDIIYGPINLMPKTGYKVSTCYMVEEEDLRPGTELVFRLSDEPQEGLNCEEGCMEVARLTIDKATFGEWNTASTTFFLDGSSGDKLLTLHVENDLAYEDETAASTIVIDNLCFEQNESTTVSTAELEEVEAYDFYIYPNPTTGDFMLEFNGYSSKSSKVKVIDLQGRTLQNSVLAPDQKLHNLSISGFPVGIYFIEVTEEGMPIWIEKIIKY